MNANQMKVPCFSCDKKEGKNKCPYENRNSCERWAEHEERKKKDYAKRKRVQEDVLSNAEHFEKSLKRSTGYKKKIGEW